MPSASTDPTPADAGAPAVPTELNEREAQIRRAAISLFYQHGYAAVGIRQIAAAVSIGISTLYHYHDSKLSLLESVMEDSSLLLEEQSQLALARSGEPRMRFAHLAATLLALQIGSRKTAYVLDNEVRSVDRESERGEKIFALRRAYEGLWREVIAAGVASGEFDPGNQDVARVTLMGMYSQTSLWYRPNVTFERDDLCLELVDLGLALVRAPRLSPDERQDVTAAADFAPLPWEPEPGPTVSDGFPEFVEVGVG